MHRVALRHEAAPSLLIDQVVCELRAMSRLAALELALGVGRLVIERFYGGELAAWDRYGARETSLRRLAAHAELPFSASTLYRSLAIYALSTRLGVSTWRHLGVSHLRAVLGLAADDQDELIERAERERWTVGRLEREAARRRAPGRGGRPRLPRFVKSVRKLQRYVDERDERFADLEAIAAMEPVQVAAIYRTLVALERQCEGLRLELEQRRPGALGGLTS